MRINSEVSILFVCMGNICRSPTAEGVFRHVVETAGLGTGIRCDSAGTHGYHIGAPPDARSISAAARRGYDLRPLRARKVCADDFSSFEFILAMDRNNLATLAGWCPPHLRSRLQLYGDLEARFAGQDVPDPYYGGAAGFERVLDMVEVVSASLLARLAGKVTG
jgi:protein-tyrosine phosphatase